MRVSWPNLVKLGEMLRQEDTKVKQPTKVKRYHLTETYTQDRLQHRDGFVTSPRNPATLPKNAVWNFKLA